MAKKEDETARLPVIRAAGEAGDVLELAKQIEHLVTAEKVRARLEEERTEESARSSTLWRWLGGIAATIAILFGGRALILAQDYAVDHAHVTTLRAEHREHVAQPMHHGTPAEIARLRGETLVATATLNEVRAALEALRDEIRELRREATARRGR